MKITEKFDKIILPAAVILFLLAIYGAIALIFGSDFWAVK
jgi:hypothetical protein